MPPEPLSWLVASVSAALPGAEAAGHRAGGQVRPGHRGVERRLVHRHVAVGRRQGRTVRQVDRQRRRRGVAVAVLDGVDEHVRRTRRRHHVRVAGIAVGTVGVQRQLAVETVDLRPDTRRDRRRRVDARRPEADNAAADNRRPVSPEHVVNAVAQHVARNEPALDPAVGVGMRRRAVILEFDPASDIRDRAARNRRRSR